MPLQIEVGKKYRTRSGDVVEIVKEKDRTPAPTLYEGRCLTHSSPKVRYYVATGAWGLSQSDYDLVKELPADAPA